MTIQPWIRGILWTAFLLLGIARLAAQSTAHAPNGVVQDSARLAARTAWLQTVPKGVQARFIDDPSEIATLHEQYDPKIRPFYQPWLPFGYRPAVDSLLADLRSKQSWKNMRGFLALMISWSSKEMLPFPEVFDALPKFLRSDSVRRQYVMYALPSADSVRASKVLLRVVKNLTYPREWRLLAISKLADCAPNHQNLSYLTHRLRKRFRQNEHTRDFGTSYKDLEDFRITLYALAHLYRSADAAELPAIEAALRPILMHDSLSRYYFDMACDELELRPSNGFLPVFEKQLLEDKESNALTTIIKIKGPAARAMVDSMLQSSREITQWQVELWVVSLMPWIWKDDAAGAIEYYFSNYVDHRYTYGVYDEGFLYQCWRIGGLDGVRQCLKRMETYPNQEAFLRRGKFRYEPMDSLHPLQKMANNLWKEGLIEQPIPQATLEVLRMPNAGLDLLAVLPGVTRIHGPGPNNMIPDGLFSAGTEQLLGMRIYSVPYLSYAPNGKYQSWFVFNGRAIEISGNTTGNFNSDDFQISVINMLLADIGIQKRYNKIPLRGSREYFFAEPEKAARLFEKLKGRWLWEE